jgi:hypothetical protein
MFFITNGKFFTYFLVQETYLLYYCSVELIQYPTNPHEMKLITYIPNTFLSLTSVTFLFRQNSKQINTAISINNIISLLLDFKSVVLLNFQKGLSFLISINKTPYISKNIQRFILVGWIGRPRFSLLLLYCPHNNSVKDLIAVEFITQSY